MTDVPPPPPTPYSRLNKCQTKYVDTITGADATATPTTIVIAREQGTGRTYGITTAPALCGYLAATDHATPSAAPSLYQVIITAANRTSHRDVWLDLEWVQDTQATLGAQLRRVHKQNIDRVLRVLDRTPSHVALACATGKTPDSQRYKHSWHALLRFDDAGPTYSATDMKAAVLASQARDADLAVYTKSQCWRLPCCRKHADPHHRVFRIVDATPGQPPCYTRPTPGRIALHLVRTVAKAGIARAGRPRLVAAPSRAPPAWVQHLLASGEDPWRQFATFVRPGAGHWQTDRFYVMPLATSGAGGMPCPIASDRRKHRSNQSFILWDDFNWTAAYRCHSTKCAGRSLDLITTAAQFERVADLVSCHHHGSGATKS